MLKIGDITMKNPVVLAPMAGVCNPAFRLIAKEFGAGLVCAEMVSDKGILYENEKSLKMLYVDEREKPLSLQIFGGERESLVAAAKYVDKHTNAVLLISIWDVRFLKSQSVMQEQNGCLIQIRSMRWWQLQ
jgi:tRNA-dihydrouridine synthase